MIQVPQLEKLKQIKLAIRDWMVDAFDGDVPVIYAEQSDPRPAPPYITFRFLTGLLKVGSRDDRQQVYDEPNDQLYHATCGQRSLPITIQCVGVADDPINEPSPVEMLGYLQQTLERPSVQDAFNTVGLSVRNDGVATAIPKMLETEIEPRAVLDITFGCGLVDIEAIQHIEHVEITGKVDRDGDGTVDDEFTETIDAA